MDCSLGKVRITLDEQAGTISACPLPCTESRTTVHAAGAKHMTETREAALDLWEAVKRDGQNLIEMAGIDPAMFASIVATVLIGAAVWFVLSNLFG